jgi:hypothetical protein
MTLSTLNSSVREILLPPCKVFNERSEVFYYHWISFRTREHERTELYNRQLPQGFSYKTASLCSNAATGPAQPHEDRTLKMNIPIAAAAPAMRGPLLAIIFFALFRLRLQLFGSANSCCLSGLVAVESFD